MPLSAPASIGASPFGSGAVYPGSYTRAADALSRRRADTAQRFASDISALLDELGMSGGRFEVAFEPGTRAEPDPLGAERCELARFG